MPKETGFLIEVDYRQNENDESVITAFFRTKTGLEQFFFPEFAPYLFAEKENAKTKTGLEKESFGEEGFSVRKIGEIQKSGKPFLKVFFKSTKELVIARDQLKKSGFSVFEFDIPFAKRFLVDSGLEPYTEFEFEFEEKNGQKNILKIAPQKTQSVFEPRIAAFDLETYSPGRFSNPQKDPILMIALSTPKSSTIYTTKKAAEKIEGVKVFAAEKEMLSGFLSDLAALDLDILVSYNGDAFDFPYLLERCHTLKLKAEMGFEKSEPSLKRRGLENAAKLKGIQHVDAYQTINLLSRFGAVNLVKKDLESVANDLFSANKKKITAVEINQIWDSEEGLEDLVKYNREDAEYTLRIITEYFPLLLELSKIIRFSLFDTCRASASQIIEALLLIKSAETSTVVPNKPESGEVQARLLQSMVGGYVKEPVPGLHENIAVLDFRSLYPSILVGHNISPDAYRGKANKESKGLNVSPDGDAFTKKPEGFFVSIVRSLLERRSALKAEYKKADKKDPATKLLFARQWALKIILNSFYGVLALAQFRWYSRECARAITAWGRYYVNHTVEEAQKAGFSVVYADTDSNFLVIPKGKTQEDVKQFVEKVNAKLPEAMELEIEDFYKRGIFVTKKDAKGGAAKKRYALMNYSNQLKIVGFEYVRRDWSGIAKKTQKAVIEALLAEGDPQKSIGIVKETIAALKRGSVPKKDLVILTQVKRKLDKYDSVGPHVAAAKKAVARGKEIEVGSVIGFIITKNGKSISDRAELEEFVKEGNYDAEYYIHHQVLPAVIRILNELGINEEDLQQGGKQSRLF